MLYYFSMSQDLVIFYPIFYLLISTIYLVVTVVKSKLKLTFFVFTIRSILSEFDLQVNHTT